MSSRRGRGEGSIYQRKDGLWCAQITTGYDSQGKQKRKTVYGATKKEVQNKLLKLQNRKVDGLLVESDMPLRVFFDFWLSSVKSKISIATYERYEQHVRLDISPKLGRILVAKLSPFQIGQFYRELTDEGASASKQKRVGKCLRQGLRQAVILGILPNNPAERVSLPRASSKEIQPLTSNQVGVFLREVKSDRLCPLYLLALDSGMRQGELLALEWSDIDWDRFEISVTKSLSERKNKFLAVKEVKTKASRRRVRIDEITLKKLRQHHEQMKKEGHGSRVVFCNRSGGYLRRRNLHVLSFQKILKRVREKWEGPEPFPSLRFHDLRHTCATLLLLANVHPKIVSERLGHSRIQVTLDTYSHVFPTMQEQATGALHPFLLAVEDKPGNSK